MTILYDETDVMVMYRFREFTQSDREYIVNNIDKLKKSTGHWSQNDKICGGLINHISVRTDFKVNIPVRLETYILCTKYGFPSERYGVVRELKDEFILSFVKSLGYLSLMLAFAFTFTEPTVSHFFGFLFSKILPFAVLISVIYSLGKTYQMFKKHQKIIMRDSLHALERHELDCIDRLIKVVSRK